MAGAGPVCPAGTLGGSWSAWRVMAEVTADLVAGTCLQPFAEPCSEGPFPCLLGGLLKQEDEDMKGLIHTKLQRQRHAGCQIQLSAAPQVLLHNPGVTSRHGAALGIPHMRK